MTCLSVTPVSEDGANMNVTFFYGIPHDVEGGMTTYEEDFTGDSGNPSDDWYSYSESASHFTVSGEEFEVTDDSDSYADFTLNTAQVITNFSFTYRPQIDNVVYRNVYLSLYDGSDRFVHILWYDTDTPDVIEVNSVDTGYDWTTTEQNMFLELHYDNQTVMLKNHDDSVTWADFENTVDDLSMFRVTCERTGLGSWMFYDDFVLHYQAEPTIEYTWYNSTEVNVSSGDPVCLFFETEYDTLYYWYVNVSEYGADENFQVSDTFDFTTATEEVCATLYGFSDTEFLFALILSLFFLLMVTGYESPKRSGGAFMLFAGFTLISLEAMLVSYLNPILVVPLVTPFAIFIILMGINKWFHVGETKT